MERPTAEKPSLQIERRIAARREKVFEAWTKAEQVTQWFNPGTEYTTVVHEMDVRPGGAYRIEMKHSKGDSHIVRGVYQEITPPQRLVFTWAWEGKNMPDTLVTLEFQDEPYGTHLILKHELFPDQELANEHNKGWNGCLDRLSAAVK